MRDSPPLAKGDQGIFCCGDEPSLKAQISPGPSLSKRGSGDLSVDKQTRMKQRLAKTGILLFCTLIFFAVLSIAQPSCVFAQEKSLYVLYLGIYTKYFSLWLG